MTIPTTITKNQHQGNGSGTSFDYNFKIFDESHLEVTKTDTQGNDTVLTISTDYTVLGVGDESGGSITYPVSGTPLAANEQLTIRRKLDFKQEVDLQNQGGFFAEVHEDVFDRITMFALQNQEELIRTIRVPVSDPSTVDMTLPNKDTRKGTVMAFNEVSGNPEAGPSIATVQTVSGIAAAIATVAGIDSEIVTVSGNSGNVTIVAGVSTDVTTVATNLANILTVAGISSDVSVAASVSGDISTVSGISLNVSSVAGISTDVTTVAANIANIVAAAGINGDITTVAGIAADVSAVVADQLDIGVVATNIANVNATGGNIANVNAVAGNTTNINAVNANSININVVATDIANVNTVATDIANVNAVAGNSVNINAVNSNSANINLVATDISNVNAVATDIANVNSVAGNSININAVNTNSANINTVAGNNTNINTIAGIAAAISTVAGISADVTTAATNAADIQAVAAEVQKVIDVANDLNEVSSEIDVVATNITNVNLVGVDIAAVINVSNNLSSVNAFGNAYFIGATAPSNPTNGVLWFDTTNNIMKVYGASGWQNAGSSVNGVENSVEHTAAAGQTSFAATYDPGYLQVYLNGVRLDVADYTATDGANVVLAVGATAGDSVFIQSFGTFVLADHYNKADSDARYYTQTQVDTSLASKSDTTHNHDADYAALAGNAAQDFSAGTLNATTVDLGNWTVAESAGVLYFATGGVNKMKLDASGNLTVAGDVTGFGTI